MWLERGVRKNKEALLSAAIPRGFCDHVCSAHSYYTPPKDSCAQSGCPSHPVLRKSSKVPSWGLVPSLAAMMVSFLQLNEQLEQPRFTAGSPQT